MNQNLSRPGGRATLVAFAAVLFLALLGAGSSQAGPRVLDATDLDLPELPHAHDCPNALEKLDLCDHADDAHDHGLGDEGADHHHEHDEKSSHGTDFEPFGTKDERRRVKRGAGGGASGSLLGLTTLERTIESVDPEAEFQFLRGAKGERRVVREDLAAAKPGRADRRRSLFYAAQTTDWQLADEESPSRVEFVDIAANPPFPNVVSAAWRPQEALGPQAVEQSIIQINEFADASPVRQRKGRRAEMDMVLMTGDQADNQQLNETAWVLTLLQGGRLDPNTGTDAACPPGQAPSGQTADPKLYAGVQDYDDYTEGLQFYDPDDPKGPKYSGWPTYPGLMDRAQEPFTAQGLDVPSYVVFGNHDGLAQGNQKAILPFEQVGVGCIKPLVPVADITEAADVLDPAYLAGLATTSPNQVMFVPRDPERQYVDRVQYKEIFENADQPDGHGFGLVDPDELAASNGAASYYAWTPRPGLKLIGIDTLCDGGVTGPSANGNIDDPQFRWLEGELERASDRGQLIIVFGHHPIRSLNCDVPDETPPACTVDGQFGHDVNAGCDIDPRSSTPIHDGADLTELFHRFPHVIAYVAGHTHENTLSDFDRADGGPGDFWGIETASLIDSPPQNRLIELMDNCDGTLSIFGTTLDSSAPVRAPAPGTEAEGLTEADLGSVSRTLAFNDTQKGEGGLGKRRDRNVELLLEDPREKPSKCTRAANPPEDEGPKAPADDRPTASNSDASGSLPFTGLLLGVLAVISLALLVSGGALRRLFGNAG